MLLFAEILEHLFGEGEGDGLRFAGLQGYFAECFELFHRSLHGRLLRRNVELHCLFTRYLSGVGDRKADLIAADSSFAIFEGGVRNTMSEGEERLRFAGYAGERLACFRREVGIAIAYEDILSVVFFHEFGLLLGAFIRRHTGIHLFSHLMSGVVGECGHDGEGKFAGWVDISEEHVSNSISGF